MILRATLRMPGQHLPADHGRGDANTIGGYAAVHGRPAAFEGTDGLSYSVEIVTSATGDPERPWGAYLLFVRWSRIVSNILPTADFLRQTLNDTSRALPR